MVNATGVWRGARPRRDEPPVYGPTGRDTMNRLASGTGALPNSPIMRQTLQLWTDWFVVWVVFFSALAYLVPQGFTPLQPYIVPGLGVIMFGMGMTLVPGDFARVLTMKRAVACGVLGQFLIMPALAAVLARVFNLNDELAMGLVILGACPGGTASNVIAFLAKADVALSVTMTACSTLLAIVLTPLLIAGLGGQYLPVDAWALFRSVVYIVLIPVTGGLVLRALLKDRARRFLELFPALSVLVIVLIIATIIALSRDRLAQVIGLLGIVVVLHNSLGLGLGYGLATAFRLPLAARRTVAIEVGMQNSGLGVALANLHFPGTLTALPASLFSVVHNLSGSLMATYWSKRTGETEQEPATRPAGETQ